MLRTLGLEDCSLAHVAQTIQWRPGWDRPLWHNRKKDCSLPGPWADHGLAAAVDLAVGRVDRGSLVRDGLARRPWDHIADQDSYLLVSKSLGDRRWAWVRARNGDPGRMERSLGDEAYCHHRHWDLEDSWPWDPVGIVLGTQADTAVWAPAGSGRAGNLAGASAEVEHLSSCDLADTFPGLEEGSPMEE